MAPRLGTAVLESPQQQTIPWVIEERVDTTLDETYADVTYANYCFETMRMFVPAPYAVQSRRSERRFAMEPHGSRDEVSRRRMLKRLGAGTTLAWSAPIIQSIAAPAFAQVGSPPRCVEPCEFECGAPTLCGQGAAVDLCFCARTTDGDCFCANDAFCSDVSPCSSSTDCPEGWRCVSNCCGQTCLPPCGEAAAAESLLIDSRERGRSAVGTASGR